MRAHALAQTAYNAVKDKEKEHRILHKKQRVSPSRERGVLDLKLETMLFSCPTPWVTVGDWESDQKACKAARDCCSQRSGRIGALGELRD